MTDFHISLEARNPDQHPMDTASAESSGKACGGTQQHHGVSVFRIKSEC